MAKWQIDPDHSVAAFRVQHMMVTFVRGQFNRLSGVAFYDQTDPSSLALEVSVEADGLYTGIGKRDEHLKSPDFFDVATHPSIDFKSSGFSAGKLSGDLTIHGVSRPVTMDVSLSGPLKGPEDMGGETVIGITATAAVNREDFGMTWNVPMGDGKVFVGTEISIELNIEADLVE